jgi:ribose 1,5-bisphosphokinase
MSGLTRFLRVDPHTPRPPRIGPGRLVLVVGPSGAGKDTLIAGAGTACRDDRTIVFPRRVVTRPASAFEHHDVASDADFVAGVERGAYALWWEAHGLKYGLPVAIDDDVRAGHTVVCNVSRTIVGAARKRYACVTVALVTAPPQVLAARLAARERAGDGSGTDRLRRGTALAGGYDPDVVIDNVATPQVGTKKLLDAIYGRT